MTRYTNWYPDTITPARVGVYERFRHGTAYALWDGFEWKISSVDWHEAAHERDRSDAHAWWRGLTEAAHKRAAP